MKNNRRDFLKKSATIASALSVGGISTVAASSSYINTKGSTKENFGSIVKDAGMQMSEAYFAGMDERRIAFMKQLDVLGAVGG
ncbi:MAG: twin-arginine translocation signal domain-containing protein, partial [Chitinophagaceae bacterium]